MSIRSISEFFKTKGVNMPNTSRLLNLKPPTSYKFPETDENSYVEAFTDTATGSSSNSNTSKSNPTSGGASAKNNPKADYGKIEQISGEIETQKANKSEKTEELSSKTNELNEVLSGSDSEIQEQQKAVDEAKEEYDKACIQSLNPMVMLTKALQEANEQALEQDEANIAGAKSEIASLSQQSASLKGSITSLQSQLSALKASLNDFPAETKENKAEIASRKSEIQGQIDAKEAEIKEKEAEMKSVEDKIKTRRNDLQHYEASKQAHQKTQQELSKQIQEIGDETVKQAQAAWEQAKAGLENAKSNKETEIQKEITAIQNEISEIDAKINELEAQKIEEENRGQTDGERTISFAEQFDGKEQAEMFDIMQNKNGTNKYGKYRVDSGAWCGDFVNYVTGETFGVGNRPKWYEDCDNKAYCPSIQNAGFAGGAQISLQDAKPGDIVMIGDGKHVGVIKSVSDDGKIIYTVEGNTESNTSDSICLVKKRSAEEATYIFSMH